MTEQEKQCSGGRMFLAQGTSTAFQSRAAAVFGSLPSASLPTDIPDDLLESSATSGSSFTSASRGGRAGTGDHVTGRESPRGSRGGTYVAPARRAGGPAAPSGSRNADVDGNAFHGAGSTNPHKRKQGADDFEAPAAGLSVPPGRKRRNNNTHRSTPDHVLHPERYTKYSLEENPEGPYAGLSDEEKNKAGAAQLFAEIRRRHDEEMAREDEGVDTSRVVFRRAADRKTKLAASAATSADSNASSGSGGDSHTSSTDQVLSFTENADADVDADDKSGTQDASSATVSGGSSTQPATVKFSARKKFRGRRRAADSDDDDEKDEMCEMED
eukprot:scpid60822/ scgid18695/ 